MLLKQAAQILNKRFQSTLFLDASWKCVALRSTVSGIWYKKTVSDIYFKDTRMSNSTLQYDV